ncbi:MAG: hypothetical protein C0612_08765, partial [Desulfobulbaceae bacterium]
MAKHAVELKKASTSKEKKKHNGDKNLSCWCIGAASGEEPYSLSVLWELSGLKK